MMAVPRRPRRPADGEAETPVNGTLALPMMPSAATENGTLAHPPAASSSELAVPVRGAKIEAHAGLPVRICRELVLPGGRMHQEQTRLSIKCDKYIELRPALGAAVRSLGGRDRDYDQK